jgi:dihydrofolate reductase
MWHTHISLEPTMRRVRYGVAVSLDGYIAGPAGELDYLVSDPAYDQRAFFTAVDTVLMGRRTYEAALQHGARGFPGLRAYVFSRTLRPADHPEVTVVASSAPAVVAALRAEDGKKDIWLAGGGDLFASLLAADVVDTVEVGVSPVLLGRPGVPLLAPALSRPARLELTGSRSYPSGLLIAEYAVVHHASPSVPPKER